MENQTAVLSIYDPIYFSSYDEQELFYSKLNRAPKIISDILFSPNTAEFIKNTCLTFGLSNDSSGQLTSTIRKILMAEINIENIENEIQSAVRLDPSIVKRISQELVNKLFLPVINDIKNSSTPLSKDAQPPNQTVNQNNIIDLRNNT